MQEIVTEVGVAPKSAFYIEQVKVKLASGEYQTERVNCLCGRTDGVPVTQADRYGLPYQMLLCRACGILYASPRLTAESFKQFYDTEYRLIFDDDQPDFEKDFQMGVSHGTHILEIADYYDCTHGTVIEIGCHTGGALKPFQEAGWTVYGVDYDSRSVAFAQSKGLPVTVGSTDDLIAKGLKADLIILDHSLEHFLDLPGELDKLKTLLAPNGFLFVALPGLKTWEIDRVWQFAHTYQFTADTFEYMMECCGWSVLHCNDHILGICQPNALKREWTDAKPEFAQDVVDWIYAERRRVPDVRVFNKFKVKDRKANIAHTISSGLPDIVDIQGCEMGHEAVIVSGGPSIEQELPRLLELVERGAVLIAIERMEPWCHAHGLIPDYVVVLDASDDVAESVATVTDPQTTYLIATQCQPAVIEKVKGLRAFYFNTPHGGINAQDLWTKPRASMVNSGGSVSLGSICLAMFLGMDALHVFGFDCHLNGGLYANGIIGVGDQKNLMEIEVGDRVFTTTPPYMAFAQQFFMLMEFARRQGHIRSINIYGDSLVNAMWEKPEAWHAELQSLHH